jgi:hypothetical protein
VNPAGHTNQFNYYETLTGRLLTNIIDGVSVSYLYNPDGAGTNTVYAGSQQGAHHARPPKG